MRPPETTTQELAEEKVYLVLNPGQLPDWVSVLINNSNYVKQNGLG